MSKLHSKLQGAKPQEKKKVQQGERNQECWGGGFPGQPYREHDIWVNPYVWRWGDQPGRFQEMRISGRDELTRGQLG